MAERRREAEADGGAGVARQEARFLPDGSYVFEDVLAVPGVVTAKVITCAAWLLELCELSAGELVFLTGGAEVRPATNRFGIFYPPYTITQPCFRDVRGRLLGVAGFQTPPPEWTAAPAVFEAESVTLPAQSASPLADVLRAARGRQTVEFNPRPSLLSLRAKRLLDENYLVHPSIARVAARLKVSHAHLTRQFRADYEMTPSDYLRQLRMADAPLRLARGEEIVSVSQEVGYNDLSRFYKQFRQTTRTSPGACQTRLRPTGRK